MGCCPYIELREELYAVARIDHEALRQGTGDILARFDRSIGQWNIPIRKMTISEFQKFPVHTRNCRTGASLVIR